MAHYCTLTAMASLYGIPLVAAISLCVAMSAEAVDI